MILITGSNGFLGKKLVGALNTKRLSLLDRNINQHSNFQHRFTIGNINSHSDYSKALQGCDTVIHCAARVHVMNDESESPLEAYREVNTVGTLNLARQAADSGVRRFIFISSIKVNGEKTSLGRPFTAADEHSPKDCYGLSKSEAELQLMKLGSITGMEIVVIRPTLVYGAGVKANFASLMRLVNKGFPLPFRCITYNRRSLVSVDNLTDLIVTCIEHPNAANQIFLVSDDQDVSTYEMVYEMAKALDKSTWQLPVPVWCYKILGNVFGKVAVVDRLVSSLQVDITHTKETLGWTPPQTLEAGFKETAQALFNTKK